jgi:N-acetyl-anhydromuramyl-L-alanine amidase AmpD
VFLHHSATDNPEHDNIAYIKKLHTSSSPNDFTKPWSDIGYHYFIDSKGLVSPGRDLEKTPAAQAPYNTKSIAICVSGVNKSFTAESLQALKTLCFDINNAYGGEMVFKGHKEVNATECPHYNYKSLLNLDGLGKIQKSSVKQV